MKNGGNRNAIGCFFRRTSTSFASLRKIKCLTKIPKAKDPRPFKTKLKQQKKKKS